MDFYNSPPRVPSPKLPGSSSEVFLLFPPWPSAPCLWTLSSGWQELGLQHCSLPSTQTPSLHNGQWDVWSHLKYTETQGQNQHRFLGQRGAMYMSLCMCVV